jgi:pyruvate,water dikinase
LISPHTLERILQRDESRSDGEKRHLFTRDLPNLFRIGYHALQLAKQLKPAGEALIEKGMLQYKRGQQWDISGMETGAILTLIKEIQDATAEIYAMHITASEFGEVTFHLIKKLTRRWARDEHGILASQLITGSYNPHLSRPFYGIWGLAQKVKSSSRLQRLFHSAPLTVILRMLEEDPSRIIKRFRMEFQEFLQQYGYRSRYGAELMHPSWENESAFILSLVKIYTKTLLRINPWEIERGQAQRRSQALQKLESRVNPLQKKIVQELLRLMHLFIPLRQNMRALSLMHAHLARCLTHELGKRFTHKALLTHSRDICFLTMNEIMSIGLSPPESPQDHFCEDIRRRIAKRRQEYEKNCMAALVERFVGRPLPMCPFDKEGTPTREKRVRGISASPGRVTGPARLITTHSQEIEVQEGDILVIPGMDAGWTPLFLSAAAIVSDRGGVLSHGSIVAREYGLPAVINVRMATQLIRDGQVITVDGDRGEVWL